MPHCEACGSQRAQQRAAALEVQPPSRQARRPAPARSAGPEPAWLVSQREMMASHKQSRQGPKAGASSLSRPSSAVQPPRDGYRQPAPRPARPAATTAVLANPNSHRQPSNRQPNKGGGSGSGGQLNERERLERDRLLAFQMQRDQAGGGGRGEAKEEESKAVDCSACLEEKSPLVSWRYGCNHSVCLECSHGWFVIQLNDKKLPGCPVPDCKQKLTERELELFFDKYMNCHYHNILPLSCVWNLRANHRLSVRAW